MSRNDNARRNALNDRVFHIGAGFTEREHPHVIETLSGLGPHLGRWHPTDVDVEVSLQDRGGIEQHVTYDLAWPSAASGDRRRLGPDPRPRPSEARADPSD